MFHVCAHIIFVFRYTSALLLNQMSALVLSSFSLLFLSWCTYLAFFGNNEFYMFHVSALIIYDFTVLQLVH